MKQYKTNSDKSISMAVVIDPIMSLTPKKDTSIALMLKAQVRSWKVYYLELKDLFLKEGKAYGNLTEVTLKDDERNWYTLGKKTEIPLKEIDLILMRKDPPVSLEYIYATYILENAEAQGTLVLNKPQSLRDANEKLYATWFPKCMPPTLVTSDMQAIHQFLHQHKSLVLKPLEGMGGRSVFKCTVDDPNVSVILETLTKNGQTYIMAQKYIPEILQGDKRIILIEGNPIPYALARIPKKGEFRGNLAAGGSGKVVPLSERDYWICEQIGNTLKQKGLTLVGIDVIGDYLTEINVTSPTCVREIEAETNIPISDQILDCIQEKLSSYTSSEAISAENSFKGSSK